MNKKEKIAGLVIFMMVMLFTIGWARDAAEMNRTLAVGKQIDVNVVYLVYAICVGGVIKILNTRTDQ